MFRSRRPVGEVVRRDPLSQVAREIQRYDARFATNRHGLQMFNGPNPVKVGKTIAVLASGMLMSFGASAILFDDGLSKLFGTLVLSLIMVYLLSQHAQALGEQRRTGSNLVTNMAIGWGLFTHKITRREAEDIAATNASFNLFNGGEKMFDDVVPTGFKDWFERVIIAELAPPIQARLR